MESEISASNDNSENWRQFIVDFMEQTREPEKLLSVFQSFETVPCESFVQFLTEVCSNKEFIGSIHQCIQSTCSDPLKSEVLSQLLVYLHSFCVNVFQKIPLLGRDTLLSLICMCTGILVGNIDIQTKHPNLLNEYSSLQNQVVELEKLAYSPKKQKRRNEFTEDEEYHLHSLEPPENFRAIPIIPTLQELLHEKSPFVRPNKIEGRYRSVEHYMDVQFRLLREDFVRSLRLAVQDYRQKFLQGKIPQRQNYNRDSKVRFYHHVYFNSTVKDQYNGTHYLFDLPAAIVRKTNWAKSKRLQFGNLVLLTADYFKTAIFGVIRLPPLDPTKKERNVKQELAKGFLRLSIEVGAEFVLKNEAYTMLECETFFEAYRYNLGILQTTKFLQTENSRLANYLVQASPNVKLPSYLEQKPYNTSPPPHLLLPTKIVKLETGELKIKCKRLNPLEPEAWPAENIQETLSLDVDQYLALRTALTSEVAVIQGPPGTGKTYVSLKIVEALLNNREMYSSSPSQQIGKIPPKRYVPNSPILILCYTNHALDQFLELIVRQISISDLIVVRVGGQSKSEVMKGHTLAQHRRSPKFRENYSTGTTNEREFQGLKSLETETLEEMESLEDSLVKLKQEIEALKHPCGIFNFHKMVIGPKLRNILPIELQGKLKSTDWLGMRDQIFQRPDFDVGVFMARAFTLKSGKLNAPESSAKFSQETSEKDKEEEFEYDLDELIERRLLDDDTHSSKKMGYSSNFGMYFFKNSALECEGALQVDKKQLTLLHDCLNDKALRERHFSKKCTYDEILEKIEHLKAKQLNHKNRAKLYNTIFGLLQEGKLVKADVAKFFHNEKDTEEYVLENSKLQYPAKLKWGIYFKIVEIARKLSEEYVPDLEKQLAEARAEYLEARNDLDGSIVKSADIVGMTTTGAAKMNELLKIAKPEIVIVEEAAEILESHVITALTEHCKHLILIGDHQQLRPSCSVYELETKYRLNVSLFERMIINGISLCTLKTQHRMRPEISDLIIGPIYTDLRNHESVHSFPGVKGIKKNLFFITHKHFEDNDSDLLSKSNYHEANFLIGLCDYLLKQGYKSHQITILTTYTGQMFLLKKLVNFLAPEIRITSVDNFQGEENDIILLSLVRSNQEKKLGFVGIDNRICVSLSRARQGLFVVGNLTDMTNSSKTWSQIYKKLQHGDNIGEALELICKCHNTVTSVKSGEDFKPLIRGGCSELCNAKLKCNHYCPQICHAFDPSHKSFQCKEMCAKTCPLGHPCNAICSAKCPKCYISVEKTLPCGHTRTVSCWEDAALIECPEIVNKELKCGHQIEVACHKDVCCSVQVEKLLPCGHVRIVKCWLTPELIKCDVMDNQELPCGHSMKLKCYQKRNNVKCEVVLEKELSCGHNKTMECFKFQRSVECEETVDVIMPDCLHKLQKRCGTDLTKCIKICNTELICGHKCPKFCHVKSDPAHVLYECQEKCQRTCDRGHPCKYTHPCPRKCVPCDVLVKVTPKCGHEKEVECAKTKDYTCATRLKKTLSCGHEQRVPCHVNESNYKCSFFITDCTNFCEFGHKCSIEHTCHERCPPCVVKVEKVLNKCEHNVEIPCHDDGTTTPCTIKVPISLLCGHSPRIECYLLQQPRPTVCPETIVCICERCHAEENYECGRKPNFILCKKCTKRDKARQSGRCRIYYARGRTYY